MITKEEAVEMSIKKWERIVEGDIDASDADCGFCEYHLNDDCSVCPLYPDVCDADSEGLEHLPLYWQWVGTRDIEIAKKILKAIKIRGEAWIKEE